MRIGTEDKCEICGENCTCVTNHNSSNRGSHVSRTKQAEEKVFKCSICSGEFKRNEDLKYHMLTHNGVERFKCEICSKEFNHSGNLKYHMLSHTGGKPFMCDICCEGFTESGHLKRHMQTHTGENIQV